MRKDFAAVAGRWQAAKPGKRGTKICGVTRCAGEWQIQKKLAAMIRGRARSSLARSVDGWLAEWLGVRAIGIMGIKAGLSNLFSRLDRQCSHPGRNGTLTRQNTVKMFAAKTLDSLDEKRFTTIASTWIRRRIDRSCYHERAGSSGKHGTNRFSPSLDLGFSDIHKTSVEKVRTLRKKLAPLITQYLKRLYL